MQTWSLKITGRVQGVGFRYYVLQKALALNIRGFVQNRPDGSVYVEAEADTEILLTFYEQCRQGPPLSAVREIEISHLPPKGYKVFEIRR